MATFQSFEDMEVWQRARKLAREIYRITSRGAFAKDYVLKDQIRRAAVSVLSNIAEGYERGGNSEFAQFLAMAKGSVGEVRAQLYVSYDQCYVEEQTFKELVEMASEISGMIANLIRYLRDTKYKGVKYKVAPEA